MQTYSGLKYTDDNHAARWLAHLLRLNILSTGYIYPKTERAIRDLLRKRTQMVHMRATNLIAENKIKNGNKYLAWMFVEAAHFLFVTAGLLSIFINAKQQRLKRSLP